ncbi:hypothetical protein GCM10010495_52250 [Kitasatospora herbaricolor]|uniref:hypothetical protein n=1 Tax=Kitasatospora herbaricolor TaxID=68217 RepID=UPI00174CE26B|nr:hypothetical protein [Kitasatospora herbaricolor]MDQ0312610.1 hypothetical protein [Kitasatospora herbaricolor]GGV29639.1 hypothetical protein GCM10010495_52250 [Kitasatospora herbaricolor]
MIAVDSRAERITGALPPSSGTGAVEQWFIRPDRADDEIIDTMPNRPYVKYSEWPAISGAQASGKQAAGGRPT